MTPKTTLRSAAALLVALFMLAFSGHALAEDKIGPKVGKPMKAAQEAMEKRQWDQALAKISEADAVASKTPFEQFQINEFKAYVLLQQKRYPEVIPLYEQSLASGKLAADQVNPRLKALVQLNTQVKNYPKVMEYGDRLLKAGEQDVDARVLVAQAHYLQKDYKNAISIMQGAIEGAEQSGRTVEENWLQLVRSAQQNSDDTAGATATLEKLVSLYPKSDYWAYLIGTRLRQKNTDRVQLNLYRIANQVGVMDSPEEYVEMTEMLLEAGLPGEAKSVMEAGYTAKAFDGLDKARADRYQRRLNETKAAATKDQASLPAIEKDAQKSPTGQGDVALGLAYSSFGQYDKAAEALNRGLQKGGVRDPQQAQIMLGIANLKLGKKDDAIKAFESVKDDAPMADVARLWTLVARSSAA